MESNQEADPPRRSPPPTGEPPDDASLEASSSEPPEASTAERDADRTAPSRGLPARVTPAQLERVIRRASDLQFRGSSEVGSDLPADEVLRIGSEVGLDARYVRQALAEVQAEALVPRAPDDEGLARRVVGPGLVQVSRVVPGDAAGVDAKLADHLSDRELLKPVRSRPGRSLWEPAGGLVSTMRRAMDVSGHGYRLAKAKSLQVAVEELEPGWSLVTLTADLRNERTEALAGFFSAFGAVGVAAGIFLVAVGGPELPFILGSTLAGGTAVGGATWASRTYLRRQRERMELALQGLLDRLESGEDLGRTGPSWHERLLGSAGPEA